MCPIFQTAYYQPYFNVDQDEVFNRVKQSFFPKANFFDTARDNPDMWGPFWILTSMIFILVVAGNFSVYLSSEDKDKYSYNYSYVPIACGLIYGVGFGTPLILSILMKCFGTEISVF